MSVFDFKKKRLKKSRKDLDSKKPLQDPFPDEEDEGVVETVGSSEVLKEGDDGVDSGPVSFSRQEPFESKGLKSEVESLKESLQVMKKQLSEVMRKVEELNRRL